MLLAAPPPLAAFAHMSSPVDNRETPCLHFARAALALASQQIACLCKPFIMKTASSLLNKRTWTVCGHERLKSDGEVEEGRSLESIHVTVLSMLRNAYAALRVADAVSAPKQLAELQRVAHMHATAQQALLDYMQAITPEERDSAWAEARCVGRPKGPPVSPGRSGYEEEEHCRFFVVEPAHDVYGASPQLGRLQAAWRTAAMAMATNVPLARLLTYLAAREQASCRLDQVPVQPQGVVPPLQHHFHPWVAQLPNIGLGTGCLWFSEGRARTVEADEAAVAGLATALKLGFRAIDIAPWYRNAYLLSRAIVQAGLRRQDVTILTKVGASSESFLFFFIAFVWVWVVTFS